MGDDQNTGDARSAQHLRCVARLDRIVAIHAEKAALDAELITLVGETARDYEGIWEFLPSELGPLLAVPDDEAGRLIIRSETLTMKLPRTMAALVSGEIGAAHAYAVADAVETTTPEIAGRVDAFITGRLGRERLTWRQTYRAAYGRVLRWDTREAKQQRDRAITDRCVSRRLCSAGMASLRVYAKAEDIAVMWEATTVLAEAATVPGDDRDLGNRRVDVLTDLMTTVLDTGIIPVAPGIDVTAGETGCRTRSRKPARARRSVLVNVTMPITALLGDDDAACELDGWGRSPPRTRGSSPATPNSAGSSATRPPGRSSTSNRGEVSGPSTSDFDRVGMARRSDAQMLLIALRCRAMPARTKPRGVPTTGRRTGVGSR